MIEIYIVSTFLDGNMGAGASRRVVVVAEGGPLPFRSVFLNWFRRGAATFCCSADLNTQAIPLLMNE